MRDRLVTLAAASSILFSACGGDDDKGESYEDEALHEVKEYVALQLDLLHDASADIQQLAPAPDDDGWNATEDKAAVDQMKAAWKRARVSYEQIEGAIAVLFPELDASTDERYDGFIEEQEDTDLFDDEGVTGIHAIERILWADSHPAHVVEFEAALPGYREAHFPATRAEADAFKNELAKRLADDTATMRSQFEPLALEPAAAFRGVIGSMQEQAEKIDLAATGEDESRYSQHTLGDMRANLEGGERIYHSFEEWVTSRPEGIELDSRIHSGFAAIKDRYQAVEGDALPPVPEGWAPSGPSKEDLATDYGRIWKELSMQSDLANEDSLVSKMARAGDAIGIPQLPK